MLDGIRYAVSAYESQQAAFMLGAMLPTPKLLDLQHEAAPLHIDPQPKDYSDDYNEMSTEQAAIDHSARVDAAIGGRDGKPSPVGKHWVLSAFTAPGKATLYGWHVDGPSGTYPKRHAPRRHRPAGQPHARTTHRSPLRLQHDADARAPGLHRGRP